MIAIGYYYVALWFCRVIVTQKENKINNARKKLKVKFIQIMKIKLNYVSKNKQISIRFILLVFGGYFTQIYWKNIKHTLNKKRKISINNISIKTVFYYIKMKSILFKICRTNP